MPENDDTPAWFADAACARSDLPLSAFFPERGQSSAPAKAVCATCRVREECLELGLTQHHGIWGGKSERERRAIRSMRIRNARGVA